MVAVYSDPVVMRFISGGAIDPSFVRVQLAKHVADNAAGDIGFYALEERTTLKLIGEVGFGVFETGEREIGWTLARQFWGVGYATEAVSACIAANGPLVAAI
ncbi:MAG TPA: GNAT family N-acetyltransferase, partial [Gaiellaceae bacterium]|nr:GNAT family N-acetyltransferase [Gaiellaceae bacterium]